MPVGVKKQKQKKTKQYGVHQIELVKDNQSI